MPTLTVLTTIPHTMGRFQVMAIAAIRDVLEGDATLSCDTFTFECEKRASRTGTAVVVITTPTHSERDRALTQVSGACNTWNDVVAGWSVHPQGRDF